MTGGGGVNAKEKKLRTEHVEKKFRKRLQCNLKPKVKDDGTRINFIAKRGEAKF